MKSPFFLLPLFGCVFALAEDLQNAKCVSNCPQVKCPADDELALCNCLNNRERLCKQRCPRYTPTYTPCSVKPIATPTPTPFPCECEEVLCAQVWPQSCHCANDGKQKCYEKCGGVKPLLQSCPAADVVARAPVPVPVPEPEVAKTCECDQIMCVQSWPESCYRGNSAKTQCHKKCGGTKPKLQECPPQSRLTLTTTTKITTKTKTTTITLTLTSTQPPQPTQTHQICGGGRANTNICPEGYACITDPYQPGSCGPACDQLGICVQDKMCGGFAGFACDDDSQACNDDPRDDCDPKNGGWDCAGLCVWPHEPFTG